MKEDRLFQTHELNKRLMQLHREGCPNCHHRSDDVANKFWVYSTEIVRRVYWFGRTGNIHHHEPRSLHTASLDYIVCINCLWKEKILKEMTTLKEKENGKEK